MNTSAKYSLLATAALLAASIHAQETGTQQVEVSGTRAEDDGADETIMRRAFLRADIERFGDTSLADVLRRIPGITIVTNASHVPEIRLRGFGQGQTLVLINGEPAPASFSIDSIAPSLIERIEVLRSATADRSTQAIAGTINIVLKSAGSAPERTYQIVGSDQDARLGATVDGRWAGKLGDAKAHLTAAAKRERTLQHVVSDLRSYDASGQQTLDETSVLQGPFDSTTLNLAGGLESKRADGGKWKWEASIRNRRISIPQSQDIADQGSAGSNLTHDALMDTLSTTTVQTRGESEWNFTDGSKLSSKLSFSTHHRTAGSTLEQDDSDGSQTLYRDVESTVQTYTTNFSGRYRIGYIENHDVTSGWELEKLSRTDRMTQFELIPASAQSSVASDYDSTVQRLAFFAQDEWSISKSLDTYAGIRLETLSTSTHGPGLADSGVRQSVLSPILQAIQKLPGPGDRQIRVALARTFKTPDPRDLIPTRWPTVNNSPLNPDEQGNPDLRPELSWGLDASYEQKHGAGAFSVTAFARWIDQVLLRQTALDNGRWFTESANGGRAMAYGVELETDVDQKKWFTTGPEIHWTAYISANGSELRDAEGGVQRLDLASPLTIRLGWEHRFDSLWRWGGQVQFDKGEPTRLTNSETHEHIDRTTADLYLSWNPLPKYVVKLSAMNVFGTPLVENLADAEGGASYLENRRERSSPSFQLSWQAPF